MGGGFCTSSAGNIAHFQSVDYLVNTHRQCLLLDTTEAIIKVVYNANADAADSDTQFRSC
jgi:hypothetical protein